MEPEEIEMTGRDTRDPVEDPVGDPVGVLSEEPVSQEVDIREALRTELTVHLKEEAKENYKKALTTLERILSNILRDPDDVKYRKIRKSNRAFFSHLGQYPSALLILLVISIQAIGFEEVFETDAEPPEEFLYLFDLDIDLIQA